MKSTRAIRSPWFRVRTASAKLAIAVVACSVLWWIFQRWLGDALPLNPEMVLSRLSLWQPLTYAFLAASPYMDPGGAPFSIIFASLALWSIGGALEISWGPRRLIGYTLGCAVSAGVLTVLLALPIARLRAIEFSGAWVMVMGIWIAYGLSHGRGQLNFWGLPVSGNGFAMLGVGFVLLNAIFRGWSSTPEVLGTATALTYLKGGSPRTWLLRFQSWRFRRQLKARSAHLRVITKSRNTSDDSDRYLH